MGNLSGRTIPIAADPRSPHALSASGAFIYMAPAFGRGRDELMTRQHSQSVASAATFDVKGDFMPHRFTRAASRIVSALTLFLATTLASNALAVHQTALTLGNSANFSIVTGTGIANTGTTQIIGNATSSPISAAAMNTVPCSVMNGYTIYGVDAGYTDVSGCFIWDQTTSDNAKADFETAYTEAAGRVSTEATDTLNLGAGTYDATTPAFPPGLHTTSTALNINGNITLDGTAGYGGGANAIWIFQVAGDLTVANGVHINLVNGALAKNVFWQVAASSFGATLGTTVIFNGNILSSAQVILQTGAALNGRALAHTQVVLDANAVTIPAAAVPAPILDAALAPSATTFQPFLLKLTVTNTGTADATNVKASAWDSNGLLLAGPTPANVSLLAMGATTTFTWTATPSGAGANLIYSATATEDSIPVMSLEATATVYVPTRLDARMTASRAVITMNQPVQLVLTVTNTGTVTETNIKAQAKSAPVTGTGPSPATLASLTAGSKAMFTWTATPSASGVIIFTGTAAGDLLSASPSASVYVTVQTPPVITGALSAISSTVTGGSFMMTLTVTNTGQAAANVMITTTAFRVSGLGTTATTYVGPSPVMSATGFYVANGYPVTFTWTVTAGTVGTGLTISNTLYLTDANGGPALAPRPVSTAAIVVVPVAILKNSLSVLRTGAALGQPATFTLTVTNTGGTPITNLAATLTTDGPATLGMATASATTLAPGAHATFTWLVTPTGTDSRAMTFTAMASGITVAATGTVLVTSVQVTTVLAGIPMPDTSVSYIFPSPAHDAARIAYTMDQAGTVTIRVYNAAGQLVATVDETKSAGLQSSAITTAKYAPGVYFYLLERTYGSGSPVKSGVHKFVVTR